MNPINTVLARIQKHPDRPSSEVLCSLLVALDTGEPFNFKQLYNVLNYEEFTLAISVMGEWRLEERYVKKGELSSAASEPMRCLSIWSKLREDAFGSM